MKVMNICIPEKYTKNDEEKTAWHKVGTMFVRDGSISFKLFMFPELNFKAFEQEKRGKKNDDAAIQF